MQVRSMVIWLFLSCCLPALNRQAAAQPVLLPDGRLMVQDTLFCLYERSGAEFEDYVFSTPQGEQLVFATARQLADPAQNYLIPVYTISMPLLGTELYIVWHPLRMEALVHDLVRYQVFREGRWDEDGARALLQAWSRKNGIISEKKISSSLLADINTRQEFIAAELDQIHIRQQQIFLNDSLLATYKSGQRPVSYGGQALTEAHQYYTIYNKEGRSAATVLLIPKRTRLYIWFRDDKFIHTLTTAHKSEQATLRIVTRYLLDQQQL